MIDISKKQQQELVTHRIQLGQLNRNIKSDIGEASEIQKTLFKGSMEKIWSIIKDYCLFQDSDLSRREIQESLDGLDMDKEFQEFRKTYYKILETLQKEEILAIDLSGGSNNENR